MIISRLDLDGAGSPGALVTRIFTLLPDLPIPVPIEELCGYFDIVDIRDLETEGFAAALIADANKSKGAILVRKNSSRTVRRFSIGHELGHFLIESHVPGTDGGLWCSERQLRQSTLDACDRRARMEVEANRFAAGLLMPAHLVKRELAGACPDINEIARLARHFDVSLEAMARTYVDRHREEVAVAIVHKERVRRIYRRQTFPFIDATVGAGVPQASLYHRVKLNPGTTTAPEPADDHIWLGDISYRQEREMTEQVRIQRNGYALILLHVVAQRDDDEDGVETTDGRFKRF